MMGDQGGGRKDFEENLGTITLSICGLESCSLLNGKAST